ncbi:N-acetylmuramoyl-L-alanine amidase [Pseudomonas duriflava]|uniref:N-acetylmuramoyl-L-alanine amidase n=1 Tax=Pseudomonas duriflava TaxID=459528 RepID=A0A562QKJ1_9PSED|nr:N-acetylmuramoyl-L-alanine amidase [Pseudomonas duriflava]TWI56566.1 N-acetylmuramoyl-L-alanine amidase [Pseudomonas duriflava]
MRLPLLLLFTVLLAGCAGGLKINTDYISKDQDNRVQYLVLHYTSTDSKGSLKTLTQGGVSAHYLVDEDGTIYRLVDESRRAWHAGESEWQGRTWLNSSSIGIEIVNPGYKDTPAGRVWYRYSDKQIDAVVALVKDIQARQHIRPGNIIGHSDIAPQRKVDPGPFFPWKRLADAGLIYWPQPAVVAQRMASLGNYLPPADWFQSQLARLGYTVPQTGIFDTATRNVIAAFQMKYRPERFDGQPDIQTAALMLALPDNR